VFSRALYTILYSETGEPAKPAHSAYNGFNNLRVFIGRTGSDPDPRLQIPYITNTKQKFCRVWKVVEVWCARLDLVLQRRDTDMAGFAGGASGLLVRDYMGKEADRLVPHRPRRGLARRRARGYEQATRELGQWEAGVEERKPLDPP
jgi:hypothetical protein